MSMIGKIIKAGRNRGEYGYCIPEALLYGDPYMLASPRMAHAMEVMIKRAVAAALAERGLSAAPPAASASVAAPAPEHGVELWVLCSASSADEQLAEGMLLVDDYQLRGFPEGRGINVGANARTKPWRIVAPLGSIKAGDERGTVVFTRGRVVAEGSFDDMCAQLKKRTGDVGMVGSLINGIAVGDRHPDSAGVEVAFRRDVGDPAHCRTVVSNISAEAGDGAVAVSPASAKAADKSVAVGFNAAVGADGVAVSTPAYRDGGYGRTLTVGVCGIAVGFAGRQVNISAQGGALVVMRSDGYVTAYGDDVTVVLFKEGKKTTFQLNHGDVLAVNKLEGVVNKHENAKRKKR